MRRAAAARSLHELPEDVLHAIMAQLPGNEAVKLGSLHPALRSALGSLPSLQPSLVLDTSVLHGPARTRGETAAEQLRQRRSNSFNAFKAAHPGVAIEEVTVRLALPALLPQHVAADAAFHVHWLPLRYLKHLRVVTTSIYKTEDPLMAQVCAPLLRTHGAAL